jgi:hypothetical protein
MPWMSWNVILLFMLPILLGWQVRITMNGLYCLRWGLENYFPELASKSDLLISTSQVAKIISMRHQPSSTDCSLYILGTSPLSDISITNIFSHVDLCFHSLNRSFNEKYFSFCWSVIYHFFLLWTVHLVPKKSLTHSWKDFLLCFLLESL